MIIHSIKDESNTTLVELLKKEFSKITDSAIKNYHPDYADEPGNFFYVLKQGRYKKGNYLIIEDNNEYVCSAGWNEYSIDPTIALILTRTYVTPKYRAQYYAGNHILPVLLNEARDYSRRWVTCNEHNKAIYNMFVRLYKKDKTTPSQWPVLYKNFKPIGEHIVYHTRQWVGEYEE